MTCHVAAKNRSKTVQHYVTSSASATKSPLSFTASAEPLARLDSTQTYGA